MPTRGLPRGAGHLPAAERLDADDRARCGAGRPVRIQDAGMDFREEPPNLRRFAAEDSRGEAIVHVVRDLNRVPEVIHRDDRQDRHEELFLVDSVVPRQAVHDCRLHEMPVSFNVFPPAMTAPFERLISAIAFSKVATATSLMTGPRYTSRTVGSPTLIFSVSERSLATNASLTPLSTRTREHAEHF